MTIELTPASVTVAIAVGGVVVKAIHWLVTLALERRDEALTEAFKKRDEATALVKQALDRELDELRGAYKALKDTQRTLFEKRDADHRELQDYKLHVAETYVNQAALEKLLVPIERRLETIEKDLRIGGVK